MFNVVTDKITKIAIIAAIALSPSDTCGRVYLYVGTDPGKSQIPLCQYHQNADTPPAERHCTISAKAAAAPHYGNRPDK